MRPKRYMDFRLQATSAAAGVPTPVIAGGVLQVLHGYFKERPGSYALALPGWGDGEQDEPGYPWQALRIFASDMADLEALMSEVGEHHLIRDYTVPGFAGTVRGDFEGAWVEYRRYRVSSRKAGVDALRERRLREAYERQWPFFRVHSKTNGQAFVVGVRPQRFRRASVNEEVHPDSYGLSVQTRAFGVPHLPVA